MTSLSILANRKGVFGVPNKVIIYEQPVNELIRVCLRLEHLFGQLDFLLEIKPNPCIREAMSVIADIIATLDRPDLKSKFTQEFHRLITILGKLKELPHISHDKLTQTLEDLRYLLNYLLETRGKIAQALRENEFLSNIRTHLLTPGGDCSFETPDYHYWLQQPIEQQQEQIHKWLIHFKEIRSAVELLLMISRYSADPQITTAETGFFHTTLTQQNNIPCQLVRVGINKKFSVFPEISLGRHRLNIRFCTPSIESRPQQISEDLQFELTLCFI